MIRLFVALRPPLAIRDLLVDVMDGVPGARWQDDDQLHLTLRFIGEVDERTADDVCMALGQVHADAPMMRWASVGSFGDRGRPHSLWAGVTPREPLAALHRKVDQACVRAGLAPERRAFHPHVTVARLARGLGEGAAIAAWLARHAALTSPGFCCDRMLLCRSDTGCGGAHYRTVIDWPLGNPAASPKIGSSIGLPTDYDD